MGHPQKAFNYDSAGGAPMHAAAPGPPPLPEQSAAQLTASVDGSPDGGRAPGHLPEHLPQPAEDAVVQVLLIVDSFL